MNCECTEISVLMLSLPKYQVFSVVGTYRPDPPSPTDVNFHFPFPHPLFKACEGQPRYSVRYGVSMNSDEFKLILSSGTESEEDIFTGFSEQDLIMGETIYSSKRTFQD